jgi:opacity protein-like surface antigen
MKRHVLLVALVLIAATASAAMAKSKSASKSATKSVTTSEPRAVSKSEPRSDFGLKGLGVAVGFVSPENLDGTFSIGAFANLGMITPNIGLEPRLDYWGWSKSEFSVDAKVHDVALGARGKYFFDIKNSPIRPFAGAGLALHFVGEQVAIPPQGGFPAMTASDSQTKLGVDLGGGITTPAGPRADFNGEVWYGIVSDVSQFSLRAGMSFKL